VWGRSSFKLQIARQHNPPDTWARFDDAFEGIVSRSLFEKAQKVRAARAAKISDEQVVARLRSIYRKHGVITARLIKKDRYIGAAALRKRFDSLITAYALVGYHPTRDIAFLRRNKAVMCLRAETAEAIVTGFRSRGQEIERLSGACRFLINGEIKVCVTVAQQRQSQQRNARWFIKPDSRCGEDLRIAVLMDGHTKRARTTISFRRNCSGKRTCSGSATRLTLMRSR
jgi:hypothetical protein